MAGGMECNIHIYGIASGVFVMWAKFTRHSEEDAARCWQHTIVTLCNSFLSWTRALSDFLPVGGKWSSQNVTISESLKRSHTEQAKRLLPEILRERETSHTTVTAPRVFAPGGEPSDNSWEHTWFEVNSANLKPSPFQMDPASRYILRFLGQPYKQYDWNFPFWAFVLLLDRHSLPAIPPKAGF